MSKSHNENVLSLIEQFAATADALLSSAAEFNKEQLPPRRWKGKELTELVKVKNIQNLYFMEKEGKLPDWYRQNRNENNGYTLEMAVEAMRVLGTLPWRQIDEPPAILSFTNFKGGCWKTTTSWHFGSWAASKGYRVLMVDVDPQASLTRNLGFQPDYFIHAEDTLAPFLMYDEEPTEENVAERILKTHIYTLDLLPASLDLQSVEWGLAAAIHSVSYNSDLDDAEKDAERAKFFLRLAYCLNSVAQRYDLIVLDGTPTLGVLPLNIVFAAHGLVVPVPTEKVDFASTKSFLDLLSDNIRTLTHLFDDQIDVPQPRFLATKFESGQMSSSSQSVLDDFIRPTFGEHLFKTVIHQHRAAVGAGSYFSRTMFEVNATTLSVKSDARKRCMENYEQAFTEIMNAMVFPLWPTTSKLKALAEEI